MFEFIKRFFELRRRRARSLKRLKAQAWKYDLIVQRDDSFRRCHLCHEPTVALRSIVRRTSLAGERFQFLGRAIAFACLRCEAVSECSDVSGDACSIDGWQFLKQPAG